MSKTEAEKSAEREEAANTVGGDFGKPVEPKEKQEDDADTDADSEEGEEEEGGEAA